MFMILFSRCYSESLLLIECGADALSVCIPCGHGFVPLSLVFMEVMQVETNSTTRAKLPDRRLRKFAYCNRGPIRRRFRRVAKLFGL